MFHMYIKYLLHSYRQCLLPFVKDEKAALQDRKSKDAKDLSTLVKNKKTKSIYL